MAAMDEEAVNPLGAAFRTAAQKFTLVNTKTGAVVGTYANRNTARAAQDKKDNAYGAYVHKVIRPDGSGGY